MKIILHFLQGLSVLLKGFTVVFCLKGIKRYIFIPYIIYLVLLSSGLWTGLTLLPPFFSQIAHTITLPLIGNQFTIALANILGWILYTFVLILLFLISANLIAAPFNSLLAEKICLHEGIAQNEKFRLIDWLHKAWRMLKASIFKSVLFMFISLILFVLTFVPGLQPITAFSIFIMFAYDSMDYAFEIKFWGIRRRFKFFIKHLGVFLGISVIVGLVFIIPGLIFLTYPIFIAGSTKIYAQLLKSQGEYEVINEQTGDQ